MQPKLKTQIVHTGTMTYEIGKWILRVMELRQDLPLGQMMVEQIRNFVDCKTDHIMFTHPMDGECHIRRVDGNPDCYVVQRVDRPYQILTGLTKSLQEVVNKVISIPA